jgi:mitochondrial Rho GTPase 1
LNEISAEGVGKSSLISTFVSRHFSEMVPGLMTQVRLPPEPDSSCITTIRDSQRGDELLQNKSESSLTSLLHKTVQDRVDSIVLVYDLDRVETFYRLETHWLPLIERYYHGEVSTLEGSRERNTLFRTEIVALFHSCTHNILNLLIKSNLPLSNNHLGSGYCRRHKVGFGARNP